jgi:hypothetical protein
LILSSVLVKAQDGTNTLVVSKGVQHVANKKAFEDENARKSNIQARSVAFPAIVLSKGVVQSNDQPTEGNIVSNGYPTWTISKDVAKQSHERTQQNNSSNDVPSDALKNDGDPITKN